MGKIREGMISDRVSERILWLTLVFFLVFFGTTILSFYLLPEGFLRRKNAIGDFQTSENLFLCAAQIFLYNMLSVAFLFLAAPSPEKRKARKPSGLTDRWDSLFSSF